MNQDVPPRESLRSAARVPRLEPARSTPELRNLATMGARPTASLTRQFRGAIRDGQAAMARAVAGR